MKIQQAILIIFFILINSCGVFAYEYGISCSWGDNITLYGAETDVSVDTQDSIHNMMVRWKSEGWDTNILWTWEPWWLAEPHLSDSMYMNPQSPPSELQTFATVSSVANSFDVMSFARSEANALGMNFWVYRMIYNDGTLVGSDWPYQFKFMFDHPEYQVVDRDGNPHLGIREMAYPQARAEMVTQYVDMVNDGNLTHIIVSLNTEMALSLPAPDHADQFGFNQPVVDDMLALYSVNILTDSRFDVDDPGWNPSDTMVENWRELRGGYLTQFLRDLRAAMDVIDPNIQMGVLTCRGDYIGPPYGNRKVQWRTWVDEGIIDMLMMTGNELGPCRAGDDCVSGYFYVPFVTGIIPYATVHNYIAGSVHPEITFLKGGGGFDPDTDGAVTDSQGRDWEYAGDQRAVQIEQNLLQYGSITFLEQDFDSFPVCTPGWTNGGYGDGRYFPSLNSSPGWWERFGDCNDLSQPAIQNTVFHGTSGNALRINGGGDFIKGRRLMGPGSVDQPLVSGYMTVDFRVYRQDELSSASVFLENWSASSFGVGLLFDSGTTNNGITYVRSNGVWVPVGKRLLEDQWHRIFMILDLNNKTYSVYTGENAEIELYTDAVWTFNDGLKDVQIFPNAGDATNVSYFDDFTIRWNPLFIPIPACGDQAHPYPHGDINLDCHVDMLDLGLLAENWLICTDENCP
jgi:hypothetical protein